MSTIHSAEMLFGSTAFLGIENQLHLVQMMCDDTFTEEVVFTRGVWGVIRVRALVLVLDFRRQGIALVISTRHLSTNVILIEVCSILCFEGIGL